MIEHRGEHRFTMLTPALHYRHHAASNYAFLTGDAYDNGLMESTIGLYKSELIDFEAGTWTDWGEVERATAGWVHWYNHERLHSSLGHTPPIEHYTNYQRENHAGLHAA